MRELQARGPHSGDKGMESDIGSRAQGSCFRVSGQSSVAACEVMGWLSMLAVAGHGQCQLLVFQLFYPCRQQTQPFYSRLASSTFQSGAAHIPSSSHLEPLRTLPGESSVRGSSSLSTGQQLWGSNTLCPNFPMLSSKTRSPANKSLSKGPALSGL